jgi:hypothetical protein
MVCGVIAFNMQESFSRAQPLKQSSRCWLAPGGTSQAHKLISAPTNAQPDTRPQFIVILVAFNPEGRQSMN